MRAPMAEVTSTRVEEVAVEVSGDGTQAWTRFKELAYDDFGRSVTLKPHKVARLFEGGRLLAMQKGFLDHRRIVDDRYGVYTVGMVYRFQPAIWTVKRGTSFPCLIHVSVVGVSERSITLRSRLVNSLDGAELARALNKYVYVDRAAARSAPLPSWWLDKYRAAVSTGQQLELVKSAPQVPPDAFSYTLTVTESNEDSNQHTNQAFYIRFCADAVHAAVKQGRLPALQLDASLFPLKELHTVYFSQSWRDDELRVLLWQQSGDRPDDTVHVVIRRKQQQGDHGSAGADGKLQKKSIVPETDIFYGKMMFGSALLPTASL